MSQGKFAGHELHETTKARIKAFVQFVEFLADV
jgi:hypothetical protein